MYKIVICVILLLLTKFSIVSKNLPFLSAIFTKKNHDKICGRILSVLWLIKN